MRESIVARKEMMQLAPHLVKPLPCVMPAYGHGLKGKEVMRTALFLSDLISWDRNNGLLPAVHLPNGYTVSRKTCLQMIPGVETKGLHGASVWHDALLVSTERMTLEYVLKATELGVCAVNYAEAKNVSKRKDGIFNIEVKDALGSKLYKVKARIIVNASGPWIDNLAIGKKKLVNKKQKWSLALNIIVRKNIFGDFAVGLEGRTEFEDKDAMFKRGKRLYFFVPWRGYTMIGTDYRESTDSPDSLQIRRETIQRIVEDVNCIYPPAKLKYEDVSFSHAGLLPMLGWSDCNKNNVQLEKKSSIIEHGGDDFRGFFSIKGVKYTTAPQIAIDVVALLKKRLPHTYTAKQKQSCSFSKFQQENHKIRSYLEKKYGPRAANVNQYLTGRNKGAVWITSLKLLKAEVDYFIEEEMALTLADVVFRRSDLGTAECPAANSLLEVAGLMAEKLGWDQGKKREEIRNIVKKYDRVSDTVLSNKA